MTLVKLGGVLLLTGLTLLVCPLPVGAQSLTQRLLQEDATTLATAANEKGNAVRGAILFAQQKLGCANCHAPGGLDLSGPDLGRMGNEVTGAYLVEAILQPSKAIKMGYESSIVQTTDGNTYTGRIIRLDDDQLVLRDTSEKHRLVTLDLSDVEERSPSSKSAMPEGLADQLADRQEFLDLVRYMLEVAAAGQSAESTASPVTQGGRALEEELQGLMLLTQYNCVACHQESVASRLQHVPVDSKLAPDLRWTSGRISPEYLTQFIANPLHAKPGTTMPDVMGGLSDKARSAAASEISHYLVSLSDRVFDRQPIDSEAAARGRETFHTVGCVACHSPRDDEGQETLAESSVPLGALEAKYNVESLVELLKDPHAARPSGRMPNLMLSHWEATDIAHYLLNRSQPQAEPFAADAELARRGQSRFDQLGCAQCHATVQPKPETRIVDEILKRSDEGCLSGQVGDWPQFDLTKSQRAALRLALQQEPLELNMRQQVAVSVSAFRCVTCHQRDDLGGLSAERNEYFETTNPNLGPQGRVPPTLTDVGAKLQSKWLRQVLVSGRAIRPYMKTRMPQFGADNVVHLVDLLEQVDRVPEVEAPVFADQKQMREKGHELVGREGLNCIACHTFQQKDAETMPAVDLTEMAERLDKAWFYHYMRAPQQLSLNTVMPSFWPGGQAIRKEILDGDSDLQIEAVWQYLLDGRQARTPRGLIIEPIELLATDEAVMLRRSYPGIGKRGIGVGYPLQVNLAFDAEQLRLAMVWSGKFADPGGVWRSQGHGTVRPLGRDMIRFAPGPELDDARDPWLVDEGRPPRHRFKGYVLDEKRRPTFMYRFEEVAIEDALVDVADSESGKAYLQRTLTMSTDGSRPGLTFRVAAAESIEPLGEGVFLIDGRLRVQIGETHEGQILDTPEGKQLRVPLDLQPGQTELVLDYRW